MKNLAVFISGNGSNLQALIDSVENKYINASIKVVISSNQNAYGLERAKKAKIDSFIFRLMDFNSPEERDLKIIECLMPYNIDYIILAGYLGKITNELITRYQHKIINIHPSLLPKFGGKGFYGIRVHEAVIESKEKESGATVHFVNSEFDSGPIIRQKSLKVKTNETPQELQERILNEIEHSLLVETIKDLCME